MLFVFIGLRKFMIFQTPTQYRRNGEFVCCNGKRGAWRSSPALADTGVSCGAAVMLSAWASTLRRR
jgi:hypothetical protein